VPSEQDNSIHDASVSISNEEGKNDACANCKPARGHLFDNNMRAAQDIVVFVSQHSRRCSLVRRLTKPPLYMFKRFTKNIISESQRNRFLFRLI
jgi:hypothetical protein